MAYGTIKHSCNLNSSNWLSGAILAYEFIQKDHTNITERRNAEKGSITKIRNDFQKYLSESEQQLVTHLHKANENYADHAKKIDELKTEKENLFTTWFDPAQKRVAELEETYKEKLKLEEPAKYWNDRAKKLNRLLT